MPSGRGRRDSRETAGLRTHREKVAKDMLSAMRRTETIRAKRAKEGHPATPDITAASTTPPQHLAPSQPLASLPSPRPAPQRQPFIEHVPSSTVISTPQRFPDVPHHGVPASQRHLPDVQYGTPSPFHRLSLPGHSPPASSTTHVPSASWSFPPNDGIVANSDGIDKGGFDLGSWPAEEDSDLYESLQADHNSLDVPPLSAPSISGNLNITSTPSSLSLTKRVPGYIPQGVEMGPGQFVSPLAENTRVNNAPSSEPPVPAPDTNISHGNGPENALGTRTLESSSEDDDAQPAKKRPRARRSRSIKVLEQSRVELIEASYPFIRARVACAKGYPNKEETTSMIIESFLDAVQDFARARGWEIDDVPADWLLLTSQEIALIRARISQHRTEIKDCANTAREICVDKIFVTAPEDDDKAANENRKIYNAYTQPENKPGYIYKTLLPNGERRGLYAAEIIEQIIVKSWFANPDGLGIKHREWFTTETGGLKIEVIAMAATAARYAFDQWKSGHRVTGSKSLKFEQATYASVYKSHLKDLQKWEAHCATHGGDGLSKLQTGLMTAALTNARVPLKPRELHSDSESESPGFTADDFRAEDSLDAP